jgi:fructose-1,6-bisphosphatase/inositol monophosphatase family enzyme
VRSIDPELVAALLRAAARDEILPRFRALAAEDIRTKDAYGDPTDVVTAADLAMEQRIGPQLAALLPGSVVVAEEAAFADPEILRALDGDAPVWLVDPLDGTRNFAAGSENFAVMVALVLGGATAMSWIHLPCEDAMYVAESGAGATRDGRRFTSDASPVAGTPAGSVYGRVSMTPEEFARLDARAAANGRAQPYLGSAAVEYTSMLHGVKDFVVYHRLLPWDHAPGALLVTEAGGVIRHSDGDAYAPRHRYRTLLAARSAAAWDAAHAALFE